MCLIPKYEEKVGVLFAADDNYVPYLGTAVFSLINSRNETTKLDIIILENGFSSKNRMLLSDLTRNSDDISIRFVDLLQFVSKLSVNPSEHVSINCFAKDFCTNQVFSLYDRMIVMDSDLVVIGDIHDLMMAEMHGRKSAAVKDYFLSIMVKNKYHTDQRLNSILFDDYLNRIGIELDNYYNAGVMVFDIKKCQKYRFEEVILDVLHKWPSVMYPSQDEVIMALDGDIDELELMWNYQNPYALCSHYKDFPIDYLGKVSEAKIVHFLGKSKPWHDLRCLNGELFWDYARQTPWIDIIIKRQKEYEKKNYFDLHIIPKGSIRRALFLKVKNEIQRIINKERG